MKFSDYILESLDKIPDQDFAELVIPKSRLKQAIDDLYYGRNVNIDKPIGVWQMDDGTYLVVDGFHHLAYELLNHRQKDRVIVRGEGYSTYVKVPDEAHRFVVDHTKEYLGLEDIYEPKKLKKLRDGITEEDPHEDDEEQQ